MRLKLYVLAFLLCGFFSFSADASHIFGADFAYTYSSGNTYQLKLSIYGDCSGQAFPNLPGSVCTVNVYDDSSTFNPGAIVQVISLSSFGPYNGEEVSQVCPAQLLNTTCHGGTVPGVTRFLYAGSVTLPHTSKGWRFRFTGAMGNNTQAGRSNSITNVIIGAGGSLLNMEATLNNTVNHNSSPAFTTIPTPFYCTNILQQYNQGAVDPDNDSLYYTLTSALEQTGPVNYVPGYSATAPLDVVSPLTFNNTTGQLSFTPASVQKSVVVNKVYEYRNGTLVGTAMREMTFIVAGNCQSTPPIGPADTVAANLAGGGFINGEFYACPGTLLHFNLKPTDPDGDSINVVFNGLPSGATAVITGNNTVAPTLSFNWNTTSVAAGNYTFFVTYKDFGCPLSNQQTIAYTVHIVNPNQFSYTVLAPTQCSHRAKLQYNLSYGLTPRTIAVSQGSTNIHTLTDNTGTVIDSLLPGTYNITISSPAITCVSNYTITVADSGIYPYKPLTSPQFYCLNDAPIQVSATANSGATIRWYDITGNYLPVAPTPSTSVSGIFYYLVSQKFLVCESLKDTEKVYVTKRPVAVITAPPFICTKDTAVILFSGSIGVGPIIAYNWGFANPDFIRGSAGGPYSVQWNTPGIRTLTLQVLENQCPSVAVSQQIEVKNTPKSKFVVPADACLYDTVRIQYNTTALAGQQFIWGFDGATIVRGSDAGPYDLNWQTAGTKHLTLLVDLDGCTDTSSHDLVVHPSPLAQILNQPGTVCLADKIFLQATGGVTYNWTPVEGLFYELDGTLYTRILQPSTFTVHVRNEFGCVDSTSITYDKIEPCCQFSYPNAFSPNGDTHNDTYKVISYGNQQVFDFTIYDRWGRQVFHTFDQTRAWDGISNGKPCESGTYFYYLKARCYTGHDEVHKGDFELIR